MATWKSIFLEPKSHRCTQASRPSAASEIWRQAQPLTGLRDGPPARAPAGSATTTRTAAQARARLVTEEVYLGPAASVMGGRRYAVLVKQLLPHLAIERSGGRGPRGTGGPRGKGGPRA